MKFLLLLSSIFCSTTSALTHVITGAHSKIGKTVAHEVLKKDGLVACLVPRNQIDSETEYWNSFNSNDRIRVFEYDMHDGGHTVKECLKVCDPIVCVYHTASTFCQNSHKQSAHDTVQATIDLVHALNQFPDIHPRLFLASGLAASQIGNNNNDNGGVPPVNGAYYTALDEQRNLAGSGSHWDVYGSEWQASFKWSKAESERQATELCSAFDIPLCVLSPSFVFSPPFGVSNMMSR